jgi:hypothetical protein
VVAILLTHSFETRYTSGAEARIPFDLLFGTAEAVPFQSQPIKPRLFKPIDEADTSVALYFSSSGL